MKNNIIFFIIGLLWKFVQSIDDERIILRGWMEFDVFNPTLEHDDEIDLNLQNLEINHTFDHQFANEDIEADGHDVEQIPHDAQDEWGPINIPNESSFFFILTPETLFVLQGRRNDLAKVHRSLQISWILPQHPPKRETMAEPEDDLPSGILDLGEQQHLFCFQLLLNTEARWNVCSEKQGDKLKWMKAFQDLVPTREHVIPPEYQLGPEFVPEPYSDLWNQTLEAEAESKNGPVDGKWVVIQNWSQCSKICEGGESTLQRICVPPREGGLPCKGNNFITKPCNTQACPSTIEIDGETEQLAPVVKMTKISNRFQRFELCIIKEGDMQMSIQTQQIKGQDQVLANPPKFPVRVVLNNRTLSIFASTQMDSVYKSFDLRYLVLKRLPDPGMDQQMCFNLVDTRDLHKTQKICVLDQNLEEGQTLEQARDVWIKDIHTFRDKCYQQPPKKAISKSAVLEEKQLELEREEQQEIAEKIEEKDEEATEKKMEEAAEMTADVALQALQKEMRYEALAMQEEKMRSREIEEKIEKEIEIAKGKEACIMREIKKKKLQIEEEQSQRQIQSKAKEIQRQALLQVQASRRETLERVEKMRREQERKRREGNQEIIQIKTRLANMLISEEKNGNETLCDPSQQRMLKMQYCEDANMSAQKQEECIESVDNDFCYICCENEFGSMFADKRESCYELCDSFLGRDPSQRPNSIGVAVEEGQDK